MGSGQRANLRFMITITSPQDPNYTCVSWAFNDKKKVWWPDGDNYWPTDQLPLFPTIDTFINTFKSMGYDQCGNVMFERGFQKIAIFGKAWDEPTHVARQLPNGLWTSKLGPLVDIEHNLQEDLRNDFFLASYGSVRIIMKKPA